MGKTINYDIFATNPSRWLYNRICSNVVFLLCRAGHVKFIDYLEESGLNKVKNFLRCARWFIFPAVIILTLFAWTFVGRWIAPIVHLGGSKGHPPVLLFIFIIGTLSAIPGFFISAALGDPNGQYSLGVSYLRGGLLKRNELKAKKWLTKAADKGHIFSLFYLNAALVDGKFVLSSDREARKSYQIIAENAGPWQLRVIAEWCHGGYGFKLDLVQCYKWHSLASIKAKSYKAKINAAAALTRLLTEMSPEQIIEGERLAADLLRFAAASTVETSKIQIISIPDGVEPEWIRKRWIGCDLPLSEFVRKEVRCWVVRRPPVSAGFLAFWLAVLCGKIARKRCFLVYCRDAVEVLEQKSPEAAAWYRENEPGVNLHWKFWAFDSKCCELLGSPK